MMRILLGAVAATALIGMANAANLQVDLNGHVDVKCLLNGSSGTITHVLDFDDLDLDADGKADGGLTANTPNTDTLYCNTPFTINVTSVNNGLKSATATGPGFTDLVDYTVNGDPVTTFVANNDNTVLGPAALTGGLAFETVAGSDYLVAGTYYDVLTITVTPN